MTRYPYHLPYQASLSQLPASQNVVSSEAKALVSENLVRLRQFI